jgi:GNAT superfamily N-acetyltransferase
MTTVIEPLVVRDTEVRAGAPADADDLQRMFRRCGPDTRYGRFWTVLNALPAPYLDQALGADPSVHDAVVAQAPSGELVGLGSAVRVATADGPAIDVGLLVEDAWQRRGVGIRLLLTLSARARARGVRRLRCDVLSERAALLGVLRRHFGPLTLHPDGPSIGVEVALR